MNKPIYKCATVWGILGGTALAFIYLKTFGKGRNLALDKTLLIGASIGAGLGIVIDLTTNKTKPVTEQQLLDTAKSIGGDTESELNSFLASTKTDNVSESDKQRIMKVLNVFLTAKKDGKWDSKGDIETKKKVLISYGVSRDDINLFENTLKNHLTNSISDIIKNEKTTNK